MFNLAGYALTAYKQANEQNDLAVAWQFGRVTATRHVSIHFIGVWDTVASVIVPRSDRFFSWPQMRTLPYTSRNPSVRAFRQAIAIDERRRMFRLNHWTEGQDFVSNPFSQPPTKVPQDCKQVCFAGVHADIGGGYSEPDSGLSKFPLIWMVTEAVADSLRIDQDMFDHLARGTPLATGSQPYVQPDATGPYIVRSAACGGCWNGGRKR